MESGDPIPGAKPEWLYRYEAARGCSTYVQVVLQRYKVERTTRAGYWIRHPDHYDWENQFKFILRADGTAKKRFAYADPDRAWESWKSRKHWHIRHLTNQLRRAKLLDAIEKPEFPKDSEEVRDYEVRVSNGWDDY